MPKTTKIGFVGSFGALLVGWLVVVARAVSRKTPIYFIIIIIIIIIIIKVNIMSSRLNVAFVAARGIIK